MRNKTFMKISLLSFLVLTVCLVGFSKERIAESIWTESSVNIDGLDDDWVDNTLNFEKKVEVDYAFKNDANNLYVIFVFKDPKYLSTVGGIKGTGMTLWLNTEGKKKKRYGINFKMKRVTADELIAIIEKQQGPLPEAEKKRIKSGSHYDLYRGEVIDKKGNILTASALGGELREPIFRSKEKQKMMVYEFRMPLRILEKLSADQVIEPGKVVKVGFEWGGMTKEMKAARMGRLEASSARESESRAKDVTEQDIAKSLRDSSGAMTRARRGPLRYSFWVDVKLAQKD